MIAANRQEYGRHYDFLEFPAPGQAMLAHAERGQLRALAAGNVQYFEAVTLSSAGCHQPLVEIPLPSGRRIAVEKRPVSALMPVTPSLFTDLSRQILLPGELRRFEQISAGLAEYF